MLAQTAGESASSMSGMPAAASSSVTTAKVAEGPSPTAVPLLDGDA